MFGLNPLSLSVAIAEILLLLAFAAFIGWLLGRLVLTGRINTLRSSIKDKEAELEECRRSKVVAISAHNRPAPPVAPPPTPRPELVPPIPASYVTADPLLPAFDLNETIKPITSQPVTESILPVVEIPTLAGVPPVTPIEPVTIIPVTAGSPVSGNSEAAVLNRIAARASELNFDRIGRALPTEADDLKDIVGIGPFLERKLHSLGIYTFRQVSNFTKEDIQKVNEIIEFFPGRIERDNWVEQSKGFHERKYGAK